MEVVKVEELEEGVEAMSMAENPSVSTVEGQSINRKVFGNMEFDHYDKLWLPCGRNPNQIAKFNANLTNKDEVLLKCDSMTEVHGLALLHENKIALTDYQKHQIAIWNLTPWKLSTTISTKSGSSGICTVEDKFLAVNLKDGSTAILNFISLSEVQILTETHQSLSFNGICYLHGELLIGDWKRDRISRHGLEWNSATNEFDREQRGFIKLDSPLFMGVCPRYGNVYVPCKKTKQIYKLTWDDGTWTKEEIRIGDRETLEYEPTSVVIHSEHIYVAFDRSLVKKYKLPN